MTNTELLSDLGHLFKLVAECETVEGIPEGHISVSKESFRELIKGLAALYVENIRLKLATGEIKVVVK